ncbi:hypothetical protein QBC35DRAFT_478958 [Podospora australis]|uniref:Heterokaryon incompatibility domain-containing protein n=1 Tax=Podospora australis TaxID=1536484 RepID=A0AAN6WIP2_9PEZI|nr:hypothetical protein QBC35DRAFT_478958 [Podospora australis]
MYGLVPPRESLYESFKLWQTAFGFMELPTLEYWTRMWTFQEFRLSNNDPRMICGAYEFTSSEFVAGHEEAKEFHRSCLAIENTRKVDDLPEGLDVKQYKASRLSRMNQDATAADRELSLRYKPESTPGYDLHHWLLATHNRVCKDPRDNAYALYGMIPRIQEIFPVDYKKSVEQVMHETAVYLTQYTGRGHGLASIFHTYCLYEDRLNSDGAACPSWVPDLRCSHMRLISSHQYVPFEIFPEEIRRYNDRGDRALQISSTDYGVLGFQGHSLGQLKIVQQFDAVDISTVVGQFTALLKIKDPEWLIPGWTGTARGGRELKSLPLRMKAVLTAHFQWTDDVKPDPATIAREFWDSHAEGHENMGEVVDLDKRHRQMFYKLRGKKLFATEEGALGITVVT